VSMRPVKAVVGISAVFALGLTTLVMAADDPPEGTIIDKLTLRPDGGRVPFWTLGESASVDGSEVKLIGRDQKAKGTMWANEQCHADQWTAEFSVTVTGESDTPGKGLAFWYTSNIMQPGILFGSEERYEGFGLLFDSYDDDGKNDNPIIMGWINDGTKVFNHDTDGLGTRFGGCRAKYRNRGNKVGVKITYQHDSLKVLLDMRNNGVWERCLVKDNIYLAAGSYFGFSASNMAETAGDEVRVVNFKVSDLETKESIAEEEAELKKKEEDEKNKAMGTGEIHDLAEQMSGMQKDLHEEFLQKISDMIQRDHVTASHEFRSIRTQLQDTIDGASSPRETLETLSTTVNGLKESLESMKQDLETLRNAKPTGGGEDISGKVSQMENDIRRIRESVDNQFVQQKNVKAVMNDHIETVEKAVTGGGGGTWTYVILFQILFVVALMMYRRGGGDGGVKQHMV